MIDETSPNLYLMADTGPLRSPDSRVTNFPIPSHKKTNEFIFRSHKMALS